MTNPIGDQTPVSPIQTKSVIVLDCRPLSWAPISSYLTPARLNRNFHRWRVESPHTMWPPWCGAEFPTQTFVHFFTPSSFFLWKSMSFLRMQSPMSNFIEICSALQTRRERVTEKQIYFCIYNISWMIWYGVGIQLLCRNREMNYVLHMIELTSFSIIYYRRCF